jgi:hypothetical protein
VDKPAALVETAKNISVVLTSAAALSYAGGYLALRARAHALGTDPGFTLVDQTYVFAGFRFALVTLVALLCIAPLLIGIQAGVGWLSRHLRPGSRAAFAWFAAIALAALTLASFTTLGIDAVLLDAPAAGDSVHRALALSILGGGQLGSLITLTATLVAALSVFWLHKRYLAEGPADPLTWVLSVIVLLQLVLLPIQHGVFYADRNGRALARVPTGVTGVLPPVWLLDRGADRASLVARTPDGRLSLVTVKVDVLDGIPITRVAPISTIVDEVVHREGAP